MADQQFLDGGFTGKLGKIVGRHWRNKYIMQAWVKPTNPRTALQMENRDRFKLAVKLTQISRIYTYGSGFFDTKKHSEYSARVSQSKLALDTGDTGLYAFPLTPLAGPYLIKPELIEVAMPSAGDIRVHVIFEETYTNVQIDTYSWIMDDQNEPIVYFIRAGESGSHAEYYIWIYNTIFAQGETINIALEIFQEYGRKNPIGFILPVALTIQ